MRTTQVLAEPLADATAALLTVPMVELYAVLWRAGLLEVRLRASKRPLPQVTVLQPA
ncbi:Rv1535 domain-containing protein [[Mycobacterium] holstebronense]|uniref:Rv1535 domain-containing protein n=1 Tax=[Mycobacterium] holstebronense TaxID=3064288 RepID=A0ABN9NST3_9MYCO|nr:Rv1535 domain-containing protein [Mycolicibacter sp. MU0102]CAJ1510131.1 Rv1535 domain-containing protein [Mycolicibacter sp. MU0102]